MTLYSIFEKAEPKGGFDAVPVAIAEKFSWGAALFTPLYALAHGMWLMLLFWLLLVAALAFAASTIGPEVAIGVYILVAWFTGLEASALRRDSLTFRGFAYRGDIIAPAEDLAQRDFLSARK